ncbi:MAG: O-antigen ligase family protein [Anaerolineales bacterium]|nr:O-antigen ligase family protein [Anaerolineales bacterium]MCZ2122667.1 O-antigen ligase family protein [Anaerolineales bacterium]
MTLKNNDLIFLVFSLFFVGAASFALADPDTSVGLYGLAGVLGIVMVMMIIIKPNIGANILIITIFINISAELTNRGYPSIIKPLVVVVFAAIMVRNYYTGQLPKNRTRTFVVELFLILYFVSMLASYAVASDKDRTMEAIQDLAKDIFILYTILFAIRETSTWKQAVWIIVFITTVLCLFGAYQIFTGDYSQDFFGMARIKTQSVVEGDNSSTNRIGGPIRDPNMWAEVLVAILPLIAFQIFNQPRMLTKLYAIAAFGIIGFELLNTYSRGGYLAFVVSMILTLFVFDRKLNPLVAIGILGLATIFIPLLPPAYLERFESLLSLAPSSEGGVSVYEDSSFRGRASEVIAGVMMFADHPLLGVGAGNFRNNYQEYAQKIGLEMRSEERDAHSLYTQVLAETGVFGAVSFFGLVLALMAGLARAARTVHLMPRHISLLPWINSLRVSIIAYMIAAVFLHNAYIRYFWILVALGITLIQLVDELQSGTGLSRFSSRETSLER